MKRSSTMQTNQRAKKLCKAEHIIEVEMEVNLPSEEREDHRRSEKTLKQVHRGDSGYESCSDVSESSVNEDEDDAIGVGDAEQHQTSAQPGVEHVLKLEDSKKRSLLGLLHVRTSDMYRH